MSQHPRHAEFTGADGNRLSADIYGHGRHHVLLFHGGGQTRHAWRGTARKMADLGLTAIPVDLRGHGDSAWDAEGRYAFADYGRDVLAIARRIYDETGEKPVSIGASLGGISSLYAEVTGHVFAALVLVDIVPRMDPNGVNHIQGFMAAKAEEGFATVEEAADAVAAYLTTRARPPSVEGLRKNLRQGADGRWRWHWDPKFLNGPRPITHDAEKLLLEIDSYTSRITIPTLLVHGASSNLVTYEEAQSFVKALPDGHYADVSGAGHMVVGDKNDIFAAAMMSFFMKIYQ